MATPDDLQTAVDEVISAGVVRGLLHNDVEDDRLDGRHITVHGRRLINFGSCSYLGLETDPRLKAAVCDAVDRLGTQFSSSRAYASAPLYRAAESALSDLFGRPTIVTPSTSLGHLAALPTLVGSADALLLDHQVHHSVQTAATLAASRGTHVELVPHSDLRTLDRRLRALEPSHPHVWYAADGLYSMYADFLPTAGLDALAARHGHLRLYVDDAHAASWTGRNGRGYALEHLAPATLTRTVVALSLNKSFAAAGGAITLPDEELRRLVMTVGGPLIFSGPVQPPMLGAILASTALHRAPEIVARQELLRSRIRLFNRRAGAARLPLVTESESPIRFVGAGVASVAYRLTERLREAGFFVNPATFPAVPAKRCGVRLALTAHHTEDDVLGVVEALARHLPDALVEEGATVIDLRRSFARQLRGRPEVLPELRAAPPPLRLEQVRSVDELDGAEWDELVGSRGSFDVAALRTYESVFASRPGARPEDVWDFSYWIVRDTAGAPVLATFATTALWKDDTLSPPEVSREVERRRTEEADPYFLTSPVVATGCLLTEGDHLFLDRSRNWRAALRLVLAAARAREDAAGAASVILRDLPDGDDEVRDFLLGEGLVRIPVPDSWVRTMDFADDEEFLGGLSRKQRYHQRTVVLAWEPEFEVEILHGGSSAAAAVPALLRDHLYRLYRAVHARGFELNVFPLPRRLIDAVLDHSGWEVVLLRLPCAGNEPVAFAVQHVGTDSVAPLFVGLDYAYVASHHSYQQLLLQALRSARRRGARRVRYGMGADLQKARFGARRQKRWAYVQATETYNADVLSRLAAGMHAT